MSLFTALLAMASLALACPLSSPVDLSEHLSHFDVNLTHLHGNTIRLAVTNLHKVDYNILQAGSLFDAAPVHKLHVKDAVSVVPFNGIEKVVDVYNGDESQHTFVPIQAGQTIVQDLDIAETHDLEDETYHLSADGFILAAAEGTKRLLGKALPYASNSLTFRADSAKAKQTTKAIDRLIAKRTTVESDCSASQKSAIVAANKKCATMASAAANAASSGSAEMFQQYFQSSDQSVRDEVASLFRNVAKECSSTPGGTSTGHCTDPDNNCSGDLLAYTIWQNGYSYGGETTPKKGTMYYCPRYFSILPADPEQCHEQSQATNTLHETTHAVAGTSDLAYGYSGITSLSSSQAVKNADTYALYANDIDLKCGAGGSSNGGSLGGYSSSGSGYGSTSSAPSTGGSVSGTSTTGTTSGYSWSDILNYFKAASNRNG